VDGHDSPKALHQTFFRKAINYTLWSLDINLTISFVLITNHKISFPVMRVMPYYAKTGRSRPLIT
jgi:hypothetical protein